MEIFGRKIEAVSYKHISSVDVYVNQKDDDCRKKKSQITNA